MSGREIVKWRSFGHCRWSVDVPVGRDTAEPPSMRTRPTVQLKMRRWPSSGWPRLCTPEGRRPRNRGNVNILSARKATRKCNTKGAAADPPHTRLNARRYTHRAPPHGGRTLNAAAFRYPVRAKATPGCSSRLRVESSVPGRDGEARVRRHGQSSRREGCSRDDSPCATQIVTARPKAWMIKQQSSLTDSHDAKGRRRIQERKIDGSPGQTARTGR